MKKKPNIKIVGKALRNLEEFEALKVDIKTLEPIGQFLIKFSKRYGKLLNK